MSDSGWGSSREPRRGPEFRASWSPEPQVREVVPVAEAPAAPAGRTYRGVWTATFFLMGLSALLTLSLIIMDTGPMGALVGVVLAAIPAFAALGVFFSLDRHEPEPPVWLAFTFCWGACVATLGALIWNQVGQLFLVSFGVSEEWSSVLVAPVVEELLKATVLVILVTWQRHEFDGVVDSIVYTGMVGIGFAAMENVLYFGRDVAAAGVTGAVSTFVVRGIMSPFAHPLFTMAFGVALGYSMTLRSPARRLLPVVGFVVAVLLHAFWNLSAMLGDGSFFLLYLVCQVPIFVAVCAIAVLARRRELRLIRRHAQGYARAGWFVPHEVELATDAKVHGAASAWAKRRLSREDAGAIRAFRGLMGDLAVLRHRIERGTAPADAAVRERSLLDAMVGIRPATGAAMSAIRSAGQQSSPSEGNSSTVP